MSNICLEDDEEEDMFVILEGFVEKQKKRGRRRKILLLNLISLLIKERDKVKRRMRFSRRKDPFLKDVKRCQVLD